MRSIKLGLIGFGTVGSAVYTVLNRNREDIKCRLGHDFQLSSICIRNQKRAALFVDSSVRVCSDPREVINSDVDIVIEVIGGTDSAKSIIEKSLKNKKHVVTANKELIALHGRQLFEIAENNEVMLLYEAAVAGGVPIIKSIREGLSANQITLVAGIINGTTNYILTEMQKSRSNFKDVLNIAIKKGYAEQDPTYDVEGIDAAHKLAIIASLSFGVEINYQTVYCEGISNIDLKDIDYAEKFGYRIKLLGIAKLTQSGIELRVHPTLVPHENLMANVDGAMNGIMVYGDAVGPTIFYGQGAGGEATASSVISDIIDICRLSSANSENYVPYTAYRINKHSIPVLPIDDTRASYYLRLAVKDQVGVMAKITKLLAALSISIEAMYQGEQIGGGSSVEVVIISHETVERDINAAISKIQHLDFVEGPIKLLRIQDLGLK